MKKILLFSALTLLLTGCTIKPEKSVNKEDLVEYLYLNSYGLKNFKTKTLTQYELENIESIILNLSESNLYKETGNMPLYTNYINHYPETINKEDESQLVHFNKLNYDKLINDKNGKEKLYAKNSEVQLSDYLTVGIKSFSLDKSFKDDDRLVLNYPYLRVNPRLPVENIQIQSSEKTYTSMFITVTMGISNLTNVEIEALKSFTQIHGLEVQLLNDKLLVNIHIQSWPYGNEYEN